MAAEREVEDLRSIAEELQGRWEVEAGWVQRWQGEGLGCRRVEVQLSRQC